MSEQMEEEQEVCLNTSRGYHAEQKETGPPYSVSPEAYAEVLSPNFEYAFTSSSISSNFSSMFDIDEFTRKRQPMFQKVMKMEGKSLQFGNANKTIA